MASVICKSGPPPTSKEIRDSLLILGRNLELRGATSKEIRYFYKMEECTLSKIFEIFLNGF